MSTATSSNMAAQYATRDQRDNPRYDRRHTSTPSPLPRPYQMICRTYPRRSHGV
ncbi:MAG: hypothetical protein M5U12_20805 [Verrucomicrobia bacterium]|nr:hypothetical protein [Verrucomicrobiota bacterium]